MSKSYRCFRCGRDLSNERSVELGIGPICRSKRADEETQEERQRHENLTCHKGFTCYLPDHASATLSRFLHRFNSLIDLTDPRGLATIAALGIPARRSPHGGVSYAMPPDHDEQYRRCLLRIDHICPFGLDCQDPERAVQNIWRVLSILRYELEPKLATEDHCGWAWDPLLYQHLWNTLEVLGCEEDARDIQAIVEAEASKPVALRLFAGDEMEQ